jgi:hypothetical protein
VPLAVSHGVGGKARLPGLTNVGVTVRGDGCGFSAGLRALIGLVHGAGGNVRGAAEAEDHAGEDGEGGEELKRRDGAGAGQCDGGQ